MNRINERLRKIAFLNKKANSNIYDEVKDYIIQNWEEDMHWHDNNYYIILDELDMISDCDGNSYVDCDLKKYFEDNIVKISKNYCDEYDIEFEDEDEYDKFIEENRDEIYDYFEENDAIELSECKEYVVLTYNEMDDSLNVEQCGENLDYPEYSYEDTITLLKSLGELEDTVLLSNDNDAESIINNIINKVNTYKVDESKIQ